MKRIVFENINEPYSLHDMNIIALEAEGDRLTIRTQSGMVRTAGLGAQVDGYVEINGIDWDFCYAYVYEGFYGNIGAFSGKKMWLKDFVAEFENAGLSVMDTNYGFNQVWYSGFLSRKGTMGECRLEIYYTGELVFCEN